MDAIKGVKDRVWGEGLVHRSSTMDAKGRQLFQCLVNYLKCFAWLSKMRTDKIWQLRGCRNLNGAQPSFRRLAVSVKMKPSKCRQGFCTPSLVRNRVSVAVLVKEGADGNILLNRNHLGTSVEAGLA